MEFLGRAAFFPLEVIGEKFSVAILAQAILAQAFFPLEVIGEKFFRWQSLEES